MFGNEGVGPLDIVVAARDPRPAVLLAQNIAQPPTDPAVERRVCRAMAVLEVFKPAAQRAVEVFNDAGQAVPRCTLGLGPDRVLEFLQALVSGPATASLKAIPKKSKPSSVALTTRVLVGCKLRPTSALHRIESEHINLCGKEAVRRASKKPLEKWKTSQSPMVGGEAPARFRGGAKWRASEA